MIQDAFVRQRARQLYWQGYPPAEISRLMGINPNTIYAWKKRDQWDETPPVQRVTQSIDARLIQLTEKKNKTGGDFKEIDLLTRQLKKLHDGQPDATATGKKSRAKKLKNHFTQEQIAALREKIISRLEWHQRGWFDSLTLCREAGIRNRMILKSRQIGATWYFAQEALLMALRDDVAQPYQRNQIFLSASRRQAFQFKSIIQKAASEVDVELKGGDKIILSNGAELHFLGTSAATAQSYTGNFYFDEFFWVSRFAELRKVAGAMATLSGLRRTYFSTPSTETHEAYAYWNGDRWNEKKATHKRQRFSVDWKTLHNGLICPDRTWRQIVTLEDVAGSVEVIVFPRDYEKNADKIMEDEKVFIKGRVSAEEDKDAKLICELITAFSEIPKTLWLKFPNLEAYMAKESQTTSILQDSEGKDQIVIYLSDTRKMKKLPPNRNVNADQALVEALTALLGEENVKVV